MRMLFLSFTTLLHALRDGRVAQGDLDQGLYHFNCGRKHAFDPWSDDTNEILWAFEDLEEGQIVHQQIVDALTKAEAEGRIVWREPGKPDSYGYVNLLLMANGFHYLRVHPFAYEYSKPGVEDLVEQQGIALKVIWR